MSVTLLEAVRQPPVDDWWLRVTVDGDEITYYAPGGLSKAELPAWLAGQETEIRAGLEQEIALGSVVGRQIRRMRLHRLLETSTTLAGLRAVIGQYIEEEAAL
jgi:hypothetical protein